jgi:DNA replication protein DnaC
MSHHPDQYPAAAAPAAPDAKPIEELLKMGEVREAKCNCGATFSQRRIFEGMDAFFPMLCPSCDEKDQAERRAHLDAQQAALREKARQNRIQAIRGEIPPHYLETDLEHATMKRARIQEILAWEFGPKGILAHGQTGGGKSRACYKLVERLAAEGRNVLIFPPAEFGRAVARSYREKREDLFVDTCQAADLVFFDDLGKEKITARVQEHLFALIEWRIAYRKPTMITTNFVGDALVKRFEDVETAIPLVERFRNHFQVVHVLPVQN